MTTTQNTTTEFIITSCADCGDKFTTDYPSFVVYVENVMACRILRTLNVDDHAEGESCWVCCPNMVVDPHGLLDH